MEVAFYKSFQSRPDINPCTANRIEIQDFLNTNLQVPTVTNIVKAIDALGPKLAKNVHSASVAPTEVQAEPEVIDPQLILLRLKAEMSSNDPAIRASATKVLRHMLRDQFVKYSR